MFFTDAADEGIFDITNHLPCSFVLADIHLYFRTFLQQSSPVLQQLNAHLKEKFAKVSISNGARVECLLCQETPNVRKLIKVWEIEIREHIHKCINEMLDKLDIIVTEDAWTEVESYITQRDLNTDSILTIYEKKCLKFVFVGEKISVRTVYSETSRQKEKIEAQIQRRKSIRTEYIICKSPWIKLLERSAIFEKSDRNDDDFNVQTNTENETIELTGESKAILTATLSIFERINKFDRWTISQDLSKNQIKLLMEEPVQSLLKSKFLGNNVFVEMEFEDDSVKVYTTNASKRAEVNLIIVTMTKESEIYLDASFMRFLTSNEWKMEVKRICEENKDQVNIQTVGDTKIVITSTRRLHNDIRGQIETYIKENSIFNAVVGFNDPGIMAYVSKHCSKQIEDIL